MSLPTAATTIQRCENVAKPIWVESNQFSISTRVSKVFGDHAEAPFSYLLSGTNLAQPLINPRPPSENHSARRHEVRAEGENTGGKSELKVDPFI